MGFTQSFMVRLRIQRRRHKQLFALASLTATVILVLFIWPSEPATSSSDVSASSCTYLPGFLCSLLSLFDSPAALEHTDNGDASSTVVNTDEDKELNELKLNHIKSYFKGANAEKLAAAHNFYGKILETIVDAKPKCKPLDNYKNGKFSADRYETSPDQPIYSEKFLSEFLQLDKTQLDAMRASHKHVLDRLPSKAPDGLYSRDGIVYVGGGKFNWLTLLSIRAMRAAGCQLPVEVLIPSLDEYELELCSRIFPAMNAKCILLPVSLFGDKKHDLEFKGYQYKSLAILLSSFENVLLMDSDNLPTYSPEHLFNSEPFVSTGLIVWPDFWQRSTSPDYFDIAGVEVSKTELLDKYSEKFGGYLPQKPSDLFDWLDAPFHERVGAIPNPSSESGQLMISKKTHMKEILLAMYYNLYGPGYYYPLFSQGAHGEGDKETFLAATVVTKGKFYQVGRFLASLGNVRDNEYKGRGMGQYDPAQDLELIRQKKEVMETLEGKEAEEAINKLMGPKILFVHANFPKLDPWALSKLHVTSDENGKRYRIYGNDMRKRSGTDFELNTWKHMQVLLCDMHLNLEHFKDVNRNQLCNELSQHIDFLISTQDLLE